MEATLRTETQYKTVVDRLMVVSINENAWRHAARGAGSLAGVTGEQVATASPHTDRAGSAPLPRVPGSRAFQASGPNRIGLSGQISDERTNRDSATAITNEIGQSVHNGEF